MNRIPWIISGLLLIALVGTIIVWQSEKTVQDGVAAVAQVGVDGTERMSEMAAELQEREAAVKELREKVEALTAETKRLRGQLAAFDPNAAASEDDPETPGDQPSSPNAGNANVMAGLAKLFEDPGVIQMMQQETAAALRRSYADFLREAGVDAGDANVLFELLAEKETAGVKLAMQAMTPGGEGLDLAAAEAATAQLDEKELEVSAKIKALLGEERYAKFEQYQETLPDRETLKGIADHFETGGHPLAADQRTKLLQLLTEERQRTPVSVFDESNTDLTARVNAFQTDELIKETLKDQAEMHRRVTERARGILSPDQLTELTKYLERERQTQELGLRIGQGFIKGGFTGEE